MPVIESWAVDDGSAVQVVVETLRARIGEGQCDAYPDVDTVPLEEAFRFVDHIISKGSWPADARWAVDR